MQGPATTAGLYHIEMYATVIVIDDERLTSTERLVWYTLCTFAHWKYQGREPILADNVFPSYETIAQRAGVHRASVARALKHLQELGYIEIISGGHEGRSNKYRLKGVAQSDGGVAQSDGGVAQCDCNNNTINRTINKGDEKFKNEYKKTWLQRQAEREAELKREREENTPEYQAFIADIKRRIAEHG